MERSEILRKIEVVENYKKRILGYIDNLSRSYHQNRIDRRAYDYKISELMDGKSPLQWIEYYDGLLEDYKRKLYSSYAYPEEEKKINIHLVVAIILLLGIMFYIFFKPSITGFSIGVSKEPIVSYEDGYKIEGQKWIDIRGSKFYERCLKIKSDIGFNEVEIKGKVTSATQENDLRFILYKADIMNNQPGLELNSCKVNNYEDIWKSCNIKNINYEKGEYWICASYPKGDYSKTYYTIAYQNGDIGRTAFWTGQNWQKLDKNSYTMKAIFRKYE
ncbi:MAG: hypothetical protein AABY07_06725 [Nanoarchaeota archaeon]